MRAALDWLTRRDGEPATHDPRETIRRHYRAFQTLMARAELPRRADQTPLEFELAVAAALPPSREPVEELTDAYAIARYAGPAEPVPDPQAAGAAVARVREVLQQSNGSN